MIDPSKKTTAMKALEGVLDPELGINVVDLGMVYALEVSPDHEVSLRMMMTSASCPLGPWIAQEAERVLRAALPESKIEVRIISDPRWSPDRMTISARKQLGLDD